MIEVNIKKTIGNFTLNVAFKSEEAVIGVLGSSGCGKSMTLKCIAGLVDPDEGRIVVNNRVLYDSDKKINLSPQKRRVGYFFQNYALFPHMKVKENIMIANPKLSDGEALQLMKKFRILELQNNYPQQLSGGQQQRVALARLLVSNPDVLLFDEPFSALDAYLKEEVELEVKQFLNDIDKQSMFVSHSRDELYHMCDYLLIMQAGSICEENYTKKIFSSMQSVYGARISGCKNIVKVDRIDNHTLYIPSYDTTWKFIKELHEDVCYIGIRAHDWHKTSDKESLCVDVSLKQTIEHPFDKDIMLHTKRGQEVIWWKVAKEYQVDKISSIAVAEEQVLLLESEGITK